MCDMAKSKPTISNLNDLLTYDYSNFTDFEQGLKQVLPTWILQSTSLKLKTILQRYLYYAEQHLRQVEGLIDGKVSAPNTKKVKTIEKMIEDINDKLSVCVDPEVKDACLLAAIQAINHYKISMYGTAASFANALGLKKTAKLFYTAEVSEKQIDKRLSELAEQEVNLRAKVPFVLT
jgi:ferritin-like metal-binding protein YciE